MAKKKPIHPATYTMSFGDHLEELRKRIFLAAVAPLPLFIVFFVLLKDTLTELLLAPVVEVLRTNKLPADIQALAIPEVIVIQLKLSLIAALIVTAPWLIYQAWLFIAPGLYKHERRFVYFLLPGSFILTIAGVALLYFVMLPLMLHVLVMFATDLEIGSGPDEQVVAYLAEAGNVPSLTAHPEAPEAGDVWLLLPQMQLYVAVPDGDGVPVPEYVPPSAYGGVSQNFRMSYAINFTLVLMLGIVIAFQMPLVILLLGWMGLASADWLRAQRKYALVVCALVAAMITPADAVSMLMMLVPLYALYELGILLLVLAPASAVAEGRMARFLVAWKAEKARRAADKGPADKANPDKPTAGSEQPDEPAQPDATVPRTKGGPEPDDETADGEDGR